MPEWRGYVRAHLELRRTSPEEQEEIVRELAAHLEDTYAALCARGLSEEAAIQRTSEEAGNWDQLDDQIKAIKRDEDMQNRVGQLWVPGLVTLLGSAGLLAVIEILDVRPIVFRAGTPSAIVLYLPWLLTLPIYWSTGRIAVSPGESEQVCRASLQHIPGSGHGGGDDAAFLRGFSH